MDCEQRRDQMMEFATGALDAAEANALRAHLAGGCPRCAAALAEAEATVALLASSADPIQPSDAMRQRLMRRVTESAMAAPSRSRAASQWITCAAAAALGFAIGAFVIWQQVGTTWARRVNHLEQMVADQKVTIDQFDDLLSDPRLSFAELAGGDPQKQAAGRVLWDKARGRWYFYAFNMRPPPQGQTYELWFITKEGTKLPAKTFDVDASGKGRVVVDVPKDQNIDVAAVTNEPGLVPQPTGQIQLVGKVP